MNRTAKVYMYDLLAGELSETDTGYTFRYNKKYLENTKAKAISNTLPLTDIEYSSTILFPFFDGLIPEGWLLDLAYKNWKLNQRDRMGLLIACCKNCIGAVSINNEK
jgi:serine/threonine-protein kinase HipA